MQRKSTCMQLHTNSLYTTMKKKTSHKGQGVREQWYNLIKMRSFVQIKDALMYSHQKNKSDSAVADD